MVKQHLGFLVLKKKELVAAPQARVSQKHTQPSTIIKKKKITVITDDFVYTEIRELTV